MKKTWIFISLLFSAIFATSQTLEYQYTGDWGQIYQVAPNEFVYGILDDTLKQFKVYSLDHTLINTFILVPDTLTYVNIFNLSRTLFNNDSNLELCYDWANYSSYNGVKIINDNGNVIFSKDWGWGVWLFNTSQGAKMLMTYYGWTINHQVDVYSLYGTVLESSEIGPNFSANLFPNPGSGNIQIDFSAPLNERNLVLSIYTMEGKLLNQQSIPLNSKSVTLNVSQYSPGIYLYKINNATFSTQTQRFMVK